MEKSLEDKLYDVILANDQDSVRELVLQGANPNKITSYGKTSLGEAANIGNLDIFNILIDYFKSTCATKKLSPGSAAKKRHIKTQKRKLRGNRTNDDTFIKCKNTCDRKIRSSPVNDSDSVEDSLKSDKNQGYFVIIHSEGSSSDESKLSLITPVSPTSAASTPQLDLEWDEETINVAPSTKEDETWSSMYQWYAAILECTGSAIASASALSNGIDQQDAFMRSALHYAVEQGHSEIVGLILDAGCKVDTQAGDGLTPLHIATMRNKIEIVLQLLAAGSNVNYKTYEKMTALHFASSRDYLKMVKVLVSNGAYLEARDTNERTALYLAAGRGHLDVVKYLISVGANVNSEEIHGYTPLCEAVWQRYANVVRVLLTSGARITFSHKLLHNAIIQRQEEIVRMLAIVKRGVNLHNDNGDTPLLLSVRLSQPAVARILLQRGAYVNACNSITGASALHIAVESVDNPKDFEELLLCLADYRIDLNVTALTSDTPLNRALLLQKDHAATLLIRHGADVNACDLHSCGLDNLSIASRRRSNKLANMLLKAGHRNPIYDRNCPISKTGSTSNWLFQVCKEPNLLIDLCRIKIRQLCKRRALYSYVDSLPLPKKLKSYLMLEDESFEDT